jgi:hypothetical protein
VFPLKQVSAEQLHLAWFDKALRNYRMPNATLSGVVGRMVTLRDTFSRCVCSARLGRICPANDEHGHSISYKQTVSTSFIATIVLHLVCESQMDLLTICKHLAVVDNGLKLASLTISYTLKINNLRYKFLVIYWKKYSFIF